MKRLLSILLAVLAIFIIILFTVPIIFKDKIVARIDQEIDKSVNAKVHYDLDKVSLSSFKRFPSISATVADFGISGNAPFEQDTLLSVDQFQVDLNLWSVIFNEYPELTGLHLKGGNVYIKVLEDGTANYDIAVSDGKEEIPEEPSAFKLGIDLIEVEDVNFIYDDRQMKFFMALADFDMTGSGDFTLDVYDLLADVETQIIRLDYEDVNYLTQKKFTADTEIQVDLKNMKFGLARGEFGLNEFLFGLDGFIAMPDEGMNMDFTFEGKDNEFKSILSLVPGIFTESFAELETSGRMDFGGFVKGTYQEKQIPQFDINLRVEQGMFQYPDLPQPVKNVNLDLEVKNSSGNLDLTQVNIPEFSLQVGSNPISGRFLLEDLVSYKMDGQLKGQLNLEELTSIFPLEGMDMKGMLDVDAKAKGKYDSVAKVIPAIDAKISLNNGYVKSEDYPAPIDQLHGKASITNSSGQMKDFLVDLSSFGFELEGEKVEGNLKIQDFDQLNWDAVIHGSADLGKILTILPMENVIMEGKVRADIDSKGNYKVVEAKQYGQLDTRGEVELVDFYYTDADLPQGVRINKALGDFSPEQVNLIEFDARLGESPVKAKGSLSNYMSYLFEEKGTLSGNLDINSSHFNVNEWMTESSATETDTTELSLIELPRNIDFTMTVQADEVFYDNLVFTNTRGVLILDDGILTFKDAALNTLGGQMTLNGSYNTQDIQTPLFDLNFNVQSLSIQKAFQSFNIIKAFAPLAVNMDGEFNTDFRLSGILGQDMMPILSSLDGRGLIKVAEAALKGSKIVEGITSLTKLKEGNTLQFKNLNLTAEIKEGMLNVKPFDVKLWDYKAQVQGSTGFDGSINYLVHMEVPAKKFGSTANNILSNLEGTSADEETMIPVAFNLGGTYQKPKISLAGESSMESLLTNTLKAKAGDEKEKIKEELTEQFKAREDSVKQELKQKAEVAKDSAKKEAEKVVDKAKDKAVDEVKNLFKGAFGTKSKSSSDTAKSGGSE
ncbi:AsmA-like C-terminal region-containing protein [Echinicola jeungdonensis]|uniref:AsmA-like C-terminal region-containing protein n=1 Tax=Echinicola jeungdonensis TaxID=709343 RepID=A0ABV5J1X6_9BACT|nr:AsmA-like C-terminal region-containing protein [Echinicola jeungdonensis]MDN3668973.1 AsmA-like C-terminal region-containing protein [Echinicola jeungdonensis]